MLDFLSSWEIATGFWLLVLVIAALFSKVFRDGIIAIVKVIFMRNLLRWVLLMISYNLFIILTLLAFEFWEIADLRGALLWLFTAAFFMVYRAVNDQPSPKELFLGIYEQGLALSAFLEFIFNWVYVPFIVAWLIVPLIGFFSFLASPSEKDGQKEEMVRRFSDRFLAVIGLSMLSYSIIYTALNWNHFWSIETARDFLRPLTLTTLFLPFLWILLTYLAYEMAWIRLNFMKPDGTNPRKFMFRIFWTFGVRYKEVNQWSLYLVRHRPADEKDLIHSLDVSRNSWDPDEPLNLDQVKNFNEFP